MTLHDAFGCINLHFLSFWGFWPDAEKRVLRSCFPSYFTYEKRKLAGGGARTHTTLRSLDFESSASADSTTPMLEIHWF
jgi:hypothetical protein